MFKVLLTSVITFVVVVILMQVSMFLALVVGLMLFGAIDHMITAPSP